MSKKHGWTPYQKRLREIGRGCRLILALVDGLDRTKIAWDADDEIGDLLDKVVLSRMTVTEQKTFVSDSWRKRWPNWWKRVRPWIGARTLIARTCSAMITEHMVDMIFEDYSIKRIFKRRKRHGIVGGPISVPLLYSRTSIE